MAACADWGRLSPQASSVCPSASSFCAPKSHCNEKEGSAERNKGVPICRPSSLLTPLFFSFNQSHFCPSSCYTLLIIIVPLFPFSHHFISSLRLSTFFSVQFQCLFLFWCQVLIQNTSCSPCSPTFFLICQMCVCVCDCWGLETSKHDLISTR